MLGLDATKYGIPELVENIVKNIGLPNDNEWHQFRINLKREGDQVRFLFPILVPMEY